MTLGEYIKIKRLEKGLTAYKLAKDFNMPHQNIQKWEKNINIPNAKYIFMLIDYLDLDQELVKKILYEQD